MAFLRFCLFNLSLGRAFLEPLEENELRIFKKFFVLVHVLAKSYFEEQQQV